MDLVSLETQEENNMIFRLIQQSEFSRFPLIKTLVVREADGVINNSARQKESCEVSRFGIRPLN